MTDEHIHKLLLAAGVAFLMPAIGYLIGVLWSTSVARAFGVPPNPGIRKLWNVFCLASPIFLLACTAWVGLEDLRIWYIEAPFAASVAFFLLFIFVPCLLVAAIIRYWNRSENRLAAKSSDHTE